MVRPSLLIHGVALPHARTLGRRDCESAEIHCNAGKFVSAAESPYDQRALPPSNLDTPPDAPDYPFNYHVCTVNKTLPVIGGPIAPWFGQPGLGAQFYIGDTGNILQLIEKGYLVRHHKSEIAPGPGRGGGCW